MSTDIEKWENVCDKCGQPHMTQLEEKLSLIVFFNTVEARQEFVDAAKAEMKHVKQYTYD